MGNVPSTESNIPPCPSDQPTSVGNPPNSTNQLPGTGTTAPGPSSLRKPDDNSESVEWEPVEFRWPHGGNDVYVVGSWNNWATKIPLALADDGTWFIVLNMPLGQYHYKFIVDGFWRHLPSYPMQVDANGNENNYLEVRKIIPEFSADGDKDDHFNLPTDNWSDHEQGRPRSPIESYDCKIMQPDAFIGDPPELPPHLAERSEIVKTKDGGGKFKNPGGHVCLDHVYIKNVTPGRDDEDLLTMETVSRFKNKFVTTTFVTLKSKPLDPHRFL